MMTTIDLATVTDLCRRAEFRGGDWRATMPAGEALEAAIAEPLDVQRRAMALLRECDGDVEHAVALAIKDRMELAADWYDSTGFEISFRA